MLTELMKNAIKEHSPPESESGHHHQAEDLGGFLRANLRHALAVHAAFSTFAHKHKLNSTDFVALLLIYGAQLSDRPATPSFVARTMALSASTLTSLLARIERRGLIVRTRDTDPEDRRRVDITATARGDELCITFCRELVEVYAEVLDPLPRETVDALTLFIGGLTEADRKAIAHFGGEIDGDIAFNRP